MVITLVPFRYLLFLGLLICPNVALLIAWCSFTPMLLRLLCILLNTDFIVFVVVRYCCLTVLLCSHIAVLHTPSHILLFYRVFFISVLCPWAYWISLNIYIYTCIFSIVWETPMCMTSCSQYLRLYLYYRLHMLR